MSSSRFRISRLRPTLLATRDRQIHGTKSSRSVFGFSESCGGVQHTLALLLSGGREAQREKAQWAARWRMMLTLSADPAGYLVWNGAWQNRMQVGISPDAARSNERRTENLAHGLSSSHCAGRHAEVTNRLRTRPAPSLRRCRTANT